MLVASISLEKAIFYLAHTCNVWAVCVYVLEAAGRGRARGWGVYGL
jgi:hypothetical protein